MHRECEGWSRRLPRRPGREGTERAVRTSRAYVHLAGWAGVHGPLSHRKPYFAGDGGNPLHHRTVRIVARQPKHALVIDWPRRWRYAPAGGGPGGGSRGGGMGGMGIGLVPGGGSRGASLGGLGIRAMFGSSLLTFTKRYRAESNVCAPPFVAPGQHRSDHRPGQEGSSRGRSGLDQKGTCRIVESLVAKPLELRVGDVECDVVPFELESMRNGYVVALARNIPCPSGSSVAKHLNGKPIGMAMRWDRARNGFAETGVHFELVDLQDGRNFVRLENAPGANDVWAFRAARHGNSDTPLTVAYANIGGFHIRLRLGDGQRGARSVSAAKAQRRSKDGRQSNTVRSALVTMPREIDHRTTSDRSSLSITAVLIHQGTPAFQADRSIPNSAVSMLAPMADADRP